MIVLNYDINDLCTYVNLVRNKKILPLYLFLLSVYFCVIQKYKWKYPGNATITKHSPSNAPEEGEMRNK